MESDKILSILIPSIPERMDMTIKLYNHLKRMFKIWPVEIIILIDNMTMSIGEKRNNLLSIAKGKYIAFCDDDDWVTEDYMEILEGCMSDVDIVTFRQGARIDNHFTTVDFDLSHTENEVFVTDGVTKRKPFHVCVWKRDLIKNVKFPSINWGEDDVWINNALKKVKTQHKIEKILHIYTHDKSISRAYAN